MNYRKYITIIFLIFGNLLMFSQSLNYVNDELGNFVNETIDIQTPTFEGLDNETYDDFVTNLNKVNTKKNHIENDIYSMTYKQHAVIVLFKSDQTLITFNSESIKILNETSSAE